MVSHALLADPMVGHISTHTGEVLEPLFSVLVCVIGGELATADGVPSRSAGRGKDNLVRGGHLVGDLMDEIDGHVQQS